MKRIFVSLPANLVCYIVQNKQLMDEVILTLPKIFVGTLNMVDLKEYNQMQIEKLGCHVSITDEAYDTIIESGMAKFKSAVIFYWICSNIDITSIPAEPNMTEKQYKSYLMNKIEARIKKLDNKGLEELIGRLEE